MTGRPASLLRQGVYSLAWVKDFYDQTSTWWGPNTDWDGYRSRAATIERLAGPGPKRVLDLWAGPGGNAAAMADLGHDVTAVEFSDRARHARELGKVPRKGRPARDDGREQRLPPLPGVPGSVEMIERCHFDPVHSRWTDEWQPVADPKAALAQTLRCYSPADLLLLLEGTGLTLSVIEVDDREVNFDDRVANSGPLLNAWQYVVKLVPAGVAGRAG